MRTCVTLCRRAALTAAAVPPNYSNTPYKKVEEPVKQHRQRGAPLAPLAPLAPPTLSGVVGTTFIDPSSSTIATSFNRNHSVKSFRQCVCATTDVSMRPLLLLLDAQTLQAVGVGRDGVAPAAAAAAAMAAAEGKGRTFGEVLEQLSCRWAAKFYGKVTFGPRNYPYPSSRWLARRFQMKKHRIVKRFRFRRYKLAAVANLPFAKMIRVGMLPELKSSKTKKGDAVENGLASQLVSAARTSTSSGKSKGKRTRPRSKYQV